MFKWIFPSAILWLHYVPLPGTLEYYLGLLLFSAIKQSSRFLTKADTVMHNVKCHVEASDGGVIVYGLSCSLAPLSRH